MSRSAIWPRNFEKISPDGLSAIYEISFSAANVQAANLEHRFAEIRNGSTGFASSLNISNPPGGMVESKDGKAMIEPIKNVLTPSPENKWGVWISGSGEFVNVSGDGNGKGYDFDTGGVSLGLDYRLTKNLAVGIAVRYAHTWTNLGLSASYTWKAGKVQLRPSLRASWQHEYFYSALPISAEFASGGGSVFTVYGPVEGHAR